MRLLYLKNMNIATTITKEVAGMAEYQEYSAQSFLRPYKQVEVSMTTRISENTLAECGFNMKVPSLQFPKLNICILCTF